MNAACPLCTGCDLQIVSQRDRKGAPLTTVLCRGCGHVFTAPIPSPKQLSAYYGTKYRLDYKQIVRPKPKHILRAGRRALERLDQLAQHAAPPARLLDIGAGGGEFVYLAGQAGFAARGVEPNQGYAGHARETLGVEVIAATFQDAAFAPAMFDVITIHHVLEHLPDPRAALARIHTWLAPGGLLMLEVPNVAATYHAPSRRFHRAHLHTFNRIGLEDTVRNAGFDIRAVTLAPHTGHIALIARRLETAPPAAWRNAAKDVETALSRHTPVAHAISGRPLQRLWANLKRPLVEGFQLARMMDTSPRAILDNIQTLFPRRPRAHGSREARARGQA